MEAPATRRRLFQDFDWLLCALVLAITVVGLRQIYSATLNTQFTDAYGQHVVWLVVGLCLFFVASSMNYHIGVRASHVLWGGGVLLLLAVLAFAEPVNGAKRWLETPFGFSVQISEYMKVVLILVVAKHCGEYSSRTLSLRDLLVIVVLFGAPIGLVLLQPDLSTSLSMVPLLGMALYLSRIRARHIAALGLVFILLLPVGWSMLKPYQRDRITGFMNPDAAPRSTGYQIRQSNIAVGAGGIWGQGYVQGSQTQLRFLPTPHTDFILASFAEEEGFVGIAIVMVLYYALLMRIVEIGRSAADAEGTLVAMCVAALLLFHIVVNVGMVANKLPVTGLPLPLMSYGGSSLLTVLTMLGLAHSVRTRRFVN